MCVDISYGAVVMASTILYASDTYPNYDYDYITVYINNGVNIKYAQYMM